MVMTLEFVSYMVKLIFIGFFLLMISKLNNCSTAYFIYKYICVKCNSRHSWLSRYRQLLQATGDLKHIFAYEHGMVSLPSKEIR